MTSTLTSTGWIVEPDVVDERKDLPRLTGAQIAIINARIALGSGEFPVGTQVIRSDDEVVMTLQGVGVAAQFVAPSVGGVKSSDLASASTVPIGGYSADDAQGILDNALPLQSYAALRAYVGRAAGVRITTRGIAGNFTRDLADSFSADDGGLCIVDAAGRRWKRLFDGPVMVEWFGAKEGGLIDCSSAFSLASIAAYGRRLVAAGTFLLASTVSMAGGVDYDFPKAKLIPGTGCTSYMLRFSGQADFALKGGDYSFKPGVTPQVTIPTGVYSSATMVYIENCSNFTVRGTKSSRAWTHINVYNSTGWLVDDNEMWNCNAGIAGVATTSAPGTALCKDGKFLGNRIYQCGDDGIFVGPQQASATVRHILIQGNKVTKETNAVNLLDGSVVAAVLIRIGNNIATPGTTEYVQVVSNELADAVDTAILCAATSRCEILFNNVKGWAKRQADCFRLGLSATLFFNDCLFQGNTANGNVVDARGIGMVYATRSKILFNTATCSLAGEGCLRADNSMFNQIIGNTLWNTKAYGISLEATSGGNAVEGNDVRTYSGLPIRDLNATGVDNTYRENPGFVTRTKGSATLAVAAGVKSVTVNHNAGPFLVPGPGTVPISRFGIRLQQRSSLGAAKEAVVTSIGASSFTIQTDVEPGVAVQWDWFGELT